MKPLTPESGPAYLFCPASRPDRYQKALDAADFAIFDLEDAVAPADKAAARQALIDNPIDPEAVIVRVNAIGTPDHALDLEALKQTSYGRIMVPKAEDPEAIATLDQYEVIALCETARGVLRAPEIAEVPCVVALMWGAEDLVASLGGRTSRNEDGSYRDVARHACSVLQLAAGAVNKEAIDAVFLNMQDDLGLQQEARAAAASGFVAKACVHPRQVEVVRAAFRPSQQDVEWARRVISEASGVGVSRIDGLMVDEPSLRMARSVLRASGG
ncbi:MAG TPA: CoA ester lyase [Actinomycetes bacterium]|nr:CoA ester lyase [Actinomycetes bacterium]